MHFPNRFESTKLNALMGTNQKMGVVLLSCVVVIVLLCVLLRNVTVPSVLLIIVNAYRVHQINFIDWGIGVVSTLKCNSTGSETPDVGKAKLHFS